MVFHVSRLISETRFNNVPTWDSGAKIDDVKNYESAKTIIYINIFRRGYLFLKYSEKFEE